MAKKIHDKVGVKIVTTNVFSRPYTFQELEDRLRSYLVRTPSRKRPIPVRYCDGATPPHLTTVEGRTTILVGDSWLLDQRVA